VPNIQCLCGQHDINNYIKKISQPILDRIDLHVELDAVPADKLRNLPVSNDVEAKQQIVMECHQKAIKRQGIINSLMSNKQIEQVVRLSDNALKILDRSAKSGLINARGYFRIIKVAQTIADLSNSEEVKAIHMSEALTFRLMERLQGQKLSSVA
jgi:magnesium chelatase family protein